MMLMRDRDDVRICFSVNLCLLFIRSVLMFRLAQIDGSRRPDLHLVEILERSSTFSSRSYQ